MAMTVLATIRGILVYGSEMAWRAIKTKEMQLFVKIFQAVGRNDNKFTKEGRTPKQNTLILRLNYSLGAKRKQLFILEK
jgi:hypothetical protein